MLRAGGARQYLLQVVLGMDERQFQAGLKGATTALRRFGHQTEMVGREISRRVTVPILAAAGASMKLATDFESSMTKIVSLVGESREQVDEWSEASLRMAPAVGRAPKELADALYFVTSAGVRGAAAMDVLEASAKAASAGLGETKVIADAVTSAVNAYGVEVISAMEATDVLVAAVREGKAEANQFAGAIGKVIPIASNMGVSFNEVAAAVAAMTRTGTEANVATTQLRGILVSILKPTQQAEEAMKNLGTSSEELRRKIEEEGLLAALQYLYDLFGDNETATAQVFGNVRALAGVMDLMGANVEDNIAIWEALNNVTGETEKAFQETSKTMQHELDRAMASLQVAGIEIGQVLLPTFAEIVQSVAKAVEKFGELDKETQKTIVQAFMILAAVGPLVNLFGSLARIIGGSIRAVVWLAGAFTKAYTAVSGLVAVLRVSIPVLIKSVGKAGALAGVLKALGVAAAIPILKILLIVAAIAALAYGIYKAIEWISKYRNEINLTFKAIGDAMRKWLEPATNVIKRLTGYWVAIFQNTFDMWSSRWNEFATKFRQDWIAFWKRVGSAVNAWWTDFKDGWIQFLTDIRNLWTEGWEQIKGVLEQVFGGMISFITDWWVDFRQKYLGWFYDLLATWRSTWESIRDTVKSHLDKARGYVLAFAKHTRGVFVELGDDIKEIWEKDIPQSVDRSLDQLEKRVDDFPLQGQLKLPGLEQKLIEMGWSGRDDTDDKDPKQRPIETGAGTTATGAKSPVYIDEVQAEIDAAANEGGDEIERSFDNLQNEWFVEIVRKTGKSIERSFDNLQTTMIESARRLGQSILSGNIAEENERLEVQAEIDAAANEGGDEIERSFDNLQTTMIRSARRLGQSILSGNIAEEIENVFSMLGDAIGQSISEHFAHRLQAQGMGGLGANILGAFGGGLVGAGISLLGGLFGRRQPGVEPSTPSYVHIVNWAEFYQLGMTLPHSIVMSGRLGDTGADPHGRRTPSYFEGWQLGEHFVQ